jgi:hypothetical protein
MKHSGWKQLSERASESERERQRDRETETERERQTERETFPVREGSSLTRTNERTKKRIDDEWQVEGGRVEK